MTRRGGLLCGIDVRGKRRRPTKDRVAIFEADRARDVGTFIQSGSPVFQAGATLTRAVL